MTYHIVGPGSNVGSVEHLCQRVDPHVHDLHGVVGVVDLGKEPDGRTSNHYVRKILLRFLPDEFFLRKSGRWTTICSTEICNSSLHSIMLLVTSDEKSDHNKFLIYLKSQLYHLLKLSQLISGLEAMLT